MKLNIQLQPSNDLINDIKYKNDLSVLVIPLLNPAIMRITCLMESCWGHTWPFLPIYVDNKGTPDVKCYVPITTDQTCSENQFEVTREGIRILVPTFPNHARISPGFSPLMKTGCRDLWCGDANFQRDCFGSQSNQCLSAFNTSMLSVFLFV